MSAMAKGGRIFGPIAIGIGVGVSAYNIANAPEGHQNEVIGTEAGATIGGAVGYTLGTIAGVALIGFLVSNPAGLMVIAAGAVVGVIGAIIGSGLLGAVGGWIGGLFD
jgi:hypothetical protein